MDYKIAPIAEQHIAGFHGAIDTVAKERKYLAFLEAPSFDRASAFVMENIKKDHPQLVALADNKVVGWCDIIPVSDRPSHKHTGVLGIGLLPAYRGQGIGAELMKQTIDKARLKGLTRIELTVREHNENAVALYKRLGFAIEGLKIKAVCIDDAYENIYMMALLF